MEMEMEIGRYREPQKEEMELWIVVNSIVMKGYAVDLVRALEALIVEAEASHSQPQSFIYEADYLLDFGLLAYPNAARKLAICLGYPRVIGYLRSLDFRL